MSQNIIIQNHLIAGTIANDVHELTKNASYDEANGTVEIQHHNSLHI